MNLSARTAAFAIAAVTAAIGGTVPAAAALPDWTAAIADSPPAIPPGVPVHLYRVLLDEERATIEVDGAVRVRRRRALQVLSRREGSLNTEVFGFDAAARVVTSRAWHVPPGQKARRSRAAPIDFAVGDAFVSGNLVRTLTVENVHRESLIFYEFEAVERPLFLALSHTFFEEVPLALGRYQVETPPGWSIRGAWAHVAGPPPVQAGSVWTWEVRDRPVPEDAPLADTPFARAPLVIVQAVPPTGVKAAASAWADWPGMSSWYEELARGRADATPAIEAAARRTAPQQGAGFFDQVEATARFVRDGVRYTAIELGVGGFQPRPAADTLANLFGDCKDKATLFRAMLASAGIPSHWVIVRLGAVDEVPQDVAASPFNHMIAAVPIPEGTEVPPRFRSALAAAPGGRRLLIVDTTDERTAIGSLAAGLAGRRGLLVDGARGALITFPSGEPATHLIHRRTEIAAVGRTVEVKRTTTLSGEPAALERAAIARSAVERRRAVETGVRQRWPGASVREYDVVLEDPEGLLKETVGIERPRSTPGMADERLALFPWIDEDVRKAPLGRRQMDVVYPHPLGLHYETIVDVLPADVTPPAPRSLSGAGWSVAYEGHREGGGLVGSVDVQVTKTRFTPGEFDELRRFWSAIGAIAGISVASTSE